MDRIMVAVAIGAALVFATGVMAGIMTVVALTVRREDRRHTLTSEPPSAVARGVRRLAGVGLRDISRPDHQA
jgi:Flp pilus assembly protein protease CpaA